jgi:hypothetical protein
LAYDNKEKIAKAVAPAAFAKLKEKIPAVGKLLEKAKEIPAAKSALAEVGLGKKKRAPSAWVQHCLAFAKAKGVKYRDALRSAECKSSYKKVGKGVVTLDAPATGPAMSDVREVGKGRSGGKREQHQPFFLPQEINQNELIGVPMRKPGFAKHPGLYFEGASLGAGKKKRGRPSKKALAAVVEAAPSVVGGAVLGGPINDPVNGAKLGGKGKSGSAEFKKAGTPLAPRLQAELGKGLYQQKGNVPMTVKDGVPPTEAEVITNGAEKDPMPSGSGKKGPSKWIAFVKAYAAKHKVKYGEAMKLAKSSYKK